MNELIINEHRRLTDDTCACASMIMFAWNLKGNGNYNKIQIIINYIKKMFITTNKRKFL